MQVCRLNNKSSQQTETPFVLLHWFCLLHIHHQLFALFWSSQNSIQVITCKLKLLTARHYFNDVMLFCFYRRLELSTGVYVLFGSVVDWCHRLHKHEIRKVCNWWNIRSGATTKVSITIYYKLYNSIADNAVLLSWTIRSRIYVEVNVH